MHISFSVFAILVGVCFIGVIASPIGNNEREKRELVNPIELEEIIVPRPPIYQLCGIIGNTCKNSSDCCTNNFCAYPSGYAYDSTRCCGGTTATGCKIDATGLNTGCCVHTHHCEWRDATKKTTWCMPTLYKK
jgi:hypothetical protein